MKTNSKKIIVSTLALAMGAALAGSISGSVAWYQYSTRAAASMVSTAAGTSRKLEVREGTTGSWGTHIDLTAGTLHPVKALLDDASAGIAKDTLLDDMAFFDKPVYQHANSGKEIDSSDYGDFIIQKDLYFRVMDNINGAGDAAQDGKPIYLQDLSIQVGADNPAGHLDLSNAVRFHIENADHSAGATLANVAKTVQSGRLDIGGAQGVLDTDGIKMNDTTGNPVYYGGGAWSVYAGAEASSETVATMALLNAKTNVENGTIVTVEETGYKVWNDEAQEWQNGGAGGEEVADMDALALVDTSEFTGGETRKVASLYTKYEFSGAKESNYFSIAGEKAAWSEDGEHHANGGHQILVDDSDPYDLQHGLLLGDTDGEDTHIVVTIWLEGWGLAGPNGASWNYADYINSKVDIDMRFTTLAE